MAQGARFCNWQSCSLSARGISFAVQAQPETTIASLQTRVVLQALACVTLPYHRTSALELAHSTGWRIRADRCILRAPTVLRAAEAGVGAAGGECFVTDRCRKLALRDGDPYGVAVMQSEHDGLVLGACVCTVLSHLKGGCRASPACTAGT